MDNLKIIKIGNYASIAIDLLVFLMWLVSVRSDGKFLLPIMLILTLLHALVIATSYYIFKETWHVVQDACTSKIPHFKGSSCICYTIYGVYDNGRSEQIISFANQWMPGIGLSYCEIGQQYYC